MPAAIDCLRGTGVRNQCRLKLGLERLLASLDLQHRVDPVVSVLI